MQESLCPATASPPSQRRRCVSPVRSMDAPAWDPPYSLGVCYGPSAAHPLPPPRRGGGGAGSVPQLVFLKSFQLSISGSPTRGDLLGWLPPLPRWFVKEARGRTQASNGPTTTFSQRADAWQTFLHVMSAPDPGAGAPPIRWSNGILHESQK